MPRRGKAYHSLDGEIEHYIEVVPLIPRGWIITRDSKPSYGGMVFNNKAAMDIIERISEKLTQRNKEGHPAILEELSNVVVCPRVPPDGIKVELIADVDDDPEPSTEPVKTTPTQQPNPPRKASKAKVPPKPRRVLAAATNSSKEK